MAIVMYSGEQKMADNFVESSFEIEILSPKELEWWKIEGERYNPLDIDLCDMKPIMSVDWELTENDTRVWFYGDPNIDLECTAGVIYRFLKECRPKGSCGFSWAETCSKPRLDEFGGGACFITAKKIWWHSSGDWLQDKYRQVEGKK